jgi:formylglycine-generating enzyme required for sulfatase activity
MPGHGGSGCGNNSTMPVLSENGKECARRAGQTDQGLCDMAGNVWEWVRDNYKCQDQPDEYGKCKGSYKGVPVDGAAFEGPGALRVLRGGSFSINDLRFLRVDLRNCGIPGSRSVIGFRIARSR